MNKYKNKKCKYRDLSFDSRKEMFRYLELLADKKHGTVEWILLQKKMPVTINDKHICYLILDFVWKDKDGKIHYEDVKAWDKKTGKFLTTPLFNLKRKMVEAFFGIKIELQ